MTVPNRFASKGGPSNPAYGRELDEDFDYVLQHGAGNITPNAGWLSSPDHRRTIIKNIDGVPTLEMWGFIGASEATGEGNGGQIPDPTVVSPDAFMPEYSDGAGPWVMSYTFTGGIVPFHDVAHSPPLPGYTDPTTGLAVTQLAVTGQTLVSGFAKTWFDEMTLAFAGTPETDPPTELPRLYLPIIGDGGQSYDDLKKGTYWHDRNALAIKAGMQAADDLGWNFRVAGYIIWQGQTNALKNEGDVLDTSESPIDFAGKLDQWQDDLTLLVNSLVPGQAAPPTYLVVQIDTVEPTLFPPPDGRLPNVRIGQFLNGHLAFPEYPYPTIDGTHRLGAGYFNAGCMAAYAAMQSVAGVGNIRPLTCTGYEFLSPTLINLFMDSQTGAIRLQEWSIYSAHRNATGTGYQQNQIVQLSPPPSSVPGMVMVDTVNGSGGILTAHIVDPGGYPEDPSATGNPTAAVFGLATIALVAGGSGYQLNHVYEFEGGIYTMPASFRALSVDENGQVLTAAIVNPGSYETIPDSPITTSDDYATGATFTFTISSGTGATFDLVCLKQLQSTINQPQLEIVAGGTGYEFGDILTISGGTTEAQGWAAQVIVQEVDGGDDSGIGVLTGCRLRGSSIYIVAPSSPASMTGGHGTGATVALIVGGFPVSNPGNWGIDLIDGTPNPPIVINAVAVATQGYAANNAIQITLDKPFFGPNPQILIACRKQAGGGGATGARTNIAGAPYSAFQRYWGMFSQPWAAGQPITLDNPYAVAPGDPILINGDFTVWSLGSPITLSGNGYTADAWQLFRGTGVVNATVTRGATDGQSYSLKVKRNTGDVSVQTYAFVQSVDPSEVARLRGSLITVAIDMKAGANFSDVSGSVAVAVYSNDTVAPLGNNALPSGATGLGTAIIPISQTWGNGYVAIPLAVPDDAEMLLYRMEWTPSGTAGADDSVSFRRAQIDVGQTPLAFRTQSIAATNLRLGNSTSLSNGELDFVRDFGGIEGDLAYPTDNDAPWARALAECAERRCKLVLQRRATGIFNAPAPPGSVLDPLVQDCPSVAYDYIDIEGRGGVTILCQQYVSPYSAASGHIGTIALAPTAGGTGYAVNNVLTISTGNANAKVRVATVSGGVVTSLVLDPNLSGTGYSTGAGQATTGGAGSGCTVNVTSVISFGGAPESRSFLKAMSTTGGYFEFSDITIDGGWTPGVFTGKSGPDPACQVPLEIKGYDTVNLNNVIFKNCYAHKDTRIARAIALTVGGIGAIYTADLVSPFRSGPLMIWECGVVNYSITVLGNYREGPWITPTNRVRNGRFDYFYDGLVAQSVSSPLNMSSTGRVADINGDLVYAGEVYTDDFTYVQIGECSGKSRGSLINMGGVGDIVFEGTAVYVGAVGPDGVIVSSVTETRYGEGIDWGGEINYLPTRSVTVRNFRAQNLHRYFMTAERASTAAVLQTVIEDCSLDGGWRGPNLVYNLDVVVRNLQVNNVVDYTANVAPGTYGYGFRALNADRVDLEFAGSGTLVIPGYTDPNTHITGPNCTSKCGIELTNVANHRIKMGGSMDWGYGALWAEETTASADGNGVVYVAPVNLTPTVYATPATIVDGGALIRIGHSSSDKVAQASIDGLTINGVSAIETGPGLAMFAYLSDLMSDTSKGLTYATQVTSSQRMYEIPVYNGDGSGPGVPGIRAKIFVEAGRDANGRGSRFGVETAYLGGTRTIHFYVQEEGQINIPPIATPVLTVAGDIWFDTTSARLRWSDGVATYHGVRSDGGLLTVGYPSTSVAQNAVLGGLQVENLDGSQTNPGIKGGWRAYAKQGNGRGLYWIGTATDNDGAETEVTRLDVALGVGVQGSWHKSGTGAPNGSVIGNVGDLYTNQSGSAGTTLYVKESGAGTNTGWVAK